jgi:hypothetical protein
MTWKIIIRGLLRYLHIEANLLYPIMQIYIVKVAYMNHRWVLIRNLKMAVNITNLLIVRNLAQLENKCTYCSSIMWFIFNLWRKCMVKATSVWTHRIMYRDKLGKWSIFLTFLLHYDRIKCGMVFFWLHTHWRISHYFAPFRRHWFQLQWASYYVYKNESKSILQDRFRLTHFIYISTVSDTRDRGQPACYEEPKKWKSEFVM